MSSSVESDAETGGSSIDDTRYSGEQEQNGSVWGAISEASGTMETTTIEIREAAGKGQLSRGVMAEA